MQIIDLPPDNEALHQQLATLLVEEFREHHPGAWASLEEGLQEVREAVAGDRINRVAIDDQGMALGWVGAIRQYDGYAWELHPLVVKRAFQGQGIGRALVNDLEIQVQNRGALPCTLALTTKTTRPAYRASTCIPMCCHILPGFKT
jgi:aminoglycoside 6'-N-acetyltransferase I